MREKRREEKDDTSPDDTFATHIYSLFPFLPFIHGLSVFERKVTSAKKLREREREREKVWARLLGHTAFSGNSYTQSNCRDDWRKVGFDWMNLQRVGLGDWVGYWVSIHLD